jgi:N6-adenosine-specific RNA methylase IME4
MNFRCIVADPPWLPTMAIINGPASGIGAPKASPQRHYPTMCLGAICELNPPAELQCHLWLWCLNQHTDWGHQVAKAWGFEVLQMLTWCKPGLGTGRFQANTEQVLLCRKGSRHGNPFGMTGGTFFKWPRGRHSEKPDAFYELVEKVSPGPRLEMFSRRPRNGWFVWGNEVVCDVNLDPMNDPMF